MTPRVSFLVEWLRRPLATAAVAPSSRHLGEAMARQVPGGGGLVIELGGGMGSVTRCLLRGGVASHSLLVVESNAIFCGHLKTQFPSVAVSEGDARALPQLLGRDGRSQARDVRAVVSSLGLRAMDFSSQARLCESVVPLLGVNGAWVQFTYGLRPPLDPRIQTAFALGVRRSDFVVFNLPPATVYVYSKLCSNSNTVDPSPRGTAVSIVNECPDLARAGQPLNGEL